MDDSHTTAIPFLRDSSSIHCAYRARWGVLPDGVKEDVVVVLSGARILFVGARNDYSGKIDRDLGDVALFPGLINCHCHTGLPQGSAFSFTRGSMVDWVRQSIRHRTTSTESERVIFVQNALARLAETGVVALAEVSNDLLSLEPIAESELICRVFVERFGFESAAAFEILDELHTTVVVQRTVALEKMNRLGRSFRELTIHKSPHAPYSTSATLICEIAQDAELLTIHVAENLEEVEFLKNGAGPWRVYLGELGRDLRNYRAPGVTPVEYLTHLGAVTPNTILVHLTHATESDLSLIAERRAVAVVCPSSNEFIGVGVAPLPAMLKAGICTGLGTDSWASNSDLNMFHELRVACRFWPMIPPPSLWKMATSSAANVLHYGDTLGALRIGVSPGVMASPVDAKCANKVIESLIAHGDTNLVRLAPAKLG